MKGPVSSSFYSTIDFEISCFHNQQIIGITRKSYLTYRKSISIICLDNDGRQISASWRQAANKVPQKLEIIFTCWRISIRRCLYPSDPLFDQVTVHICLSFQVTHAEKLTISFAELCLILYFKYRRQFPVGNLRYLYNNHIQGILRCVISSRPRITFVFP
ncbi:hypothetical protein PNOK_0510400 [Pyrrhoderma noxium]|uniref:Uncharacterized protein n=1 Tax=Pyrrhoderma noxium TaxID=2282107 RepID=A0A286UKQ5_9AGAM|nr:hypothetical protein PNOK_0510400 [Pyrrhoderma noxium]